MSLWSRLAGAANRLSRAISRETPEPESPTAAELIDKWVNKPTEELPETWANRPPAPPREMNLGTLGDVFDKYVPEDDWDNRRVREAFDRGFGNRMDETSHSEVRRWRSEFLQYLSDEGIDLEDFYPDWREAYEDA